MKKLSFLCLAFLLSCFYSADIKAQLSDGTIAPDFTLTDIDGNTHNLYTILNSGKHVVLDFSATWCGPCWSYHNSGQLEALYDDRGPNGTNEVEIFYIEGDGSTNLSCLYGPAGCNGTSLGNWTNVPYPIFSPTGADLSVVSDYGIAYFPTIYMVNALDKRIWEVGQTSAANMENWMDNSFPLTATTTVIDQSCTQYGEIDLEPNLASANLVYTWSNGATTQDLFNIPGGTYEVTISQGNGYFLNLGPFFVDQEVFNPNIITNNTVVQEITCFGNENGIVELSSTGGISALYTYEWSTGNTGYSVSNLAAGTYSVTTTDEVGCTNTASVTITEPDPIIMSSVASGTCAGLNEGSITIEVLQGDGPFLFSIGGSWTAQTEYNNLSPGTYEVALADFDGCSEFQTIQVQEFASPDATIGFTSLEVNCDNPEVVLSATTAANLSHEWISGGMVISTDPMFSTSIAGTYEHVITDVNTNCQSISSVEVTSTGGIPTLTSNTGLLDCSTTTVDLCAQSDPNVSISWMVNGQSVSQECITVDVAGSYEVIATAANGCTSTLISTVEANFNAPEITSLEAGVLDCASGVALLDANISGDFDVAVWSDANGMVINANNEVAVNVFNPGVYTLTLTNSASNCSHTADVLVEENSALPVISAISSSVITCENTSSMITSTIDLQASDYTLVWTDADGNIIGNTESIEVTEAGMYNLEVTSLVNSCVSNATAAVMVNQSSPTINSVDAMAITCLNPEGSISLDIEGDVADTEVLWTDAFGNEVGYTSQLTSTIPGIYYANITLLSTGCVTTTSATIGEVINEPISEFTLTESETGITIEAVDQSDATYLWTVNGTEVEAESLLELNLTTTSILEICLVVTNDCGSVEDCITYQYVSAMSATLNKVDNVCFDGTDASITIDLVGGLPDYTIEVSGPNGYFGNELNLTNLANGLYSYMITDAANNVLSGSIVINSPMPIEVSGTSISAQTDISMDGAIDLVVSGGVAPYEFVWSNGATDEDIDNLAPGSYSCIITDANGCQMETEMYEINFLLSDVTDLKTIGINIFPNPTSDYINITNNENRQLSFQMIDVSGRIVLSQQSIPTQSIDVTQLAEGIYFIRLSNDEVNGTFRFVKM